MLSMDYATHTHKALIPLSSCAHIITLTLQQNYYQSTQLVLFTDHQYKSECKTLLMLFVSVTSLGHNKLTNLLYKIHTVNTPMCQLSVSVKLPWCPACQLSVYKKTTLPPSGGTRNRFIAFWRFPASNFCVNSNYTHKQVKLVTQYQQLVSQALCQNVAVSWHISVLSLTVNSIKLPPPCLSQIWLFAMR